MRAAARNHKPDDLKGGIFAGLFGLVLGLSLLKFGTPVVMQKYVDWPVTRLEWAINQQWPVVVGYWLLGVVAVAGLLVARRREGLPWQIICLPAAWLFWQCLSATQTVDSELTGQTLVHFTSCAVCFYLGLFSLSPTRRLWPFWTALLTAFALVMMFGLEQHFGGLEQTRRYYFLYIYPTLAEPPQVEFLKRMSTNRIFATLFYPNTLAGVIVLILPPVLAFIWSLERQMTAGARGLLVALAAGSGLACLYWSGSKGGWLLMLAIGFVAILFLPFSRRFKIMLIGVAFVLGLAGFFLKYAGFFEKGATSVVARFEYWHGAVQAIGEKPVFGSGPGTFGVTYARLMKPGSEPSREAHNDYLQQGSDSGIPGLLLYLAMIVGSLVFAWKRSGLAGDWLRLAVWLGVLGAALQGLMEFGLYIPAMAWPAFAFMGWLVGQGSNRSTAGGRSE